MLILYYRIVELKQLYPKSDVFLQINFMKNNDCV